MEAMLRKRPFGRTGLAVTEVSLGAMNLRLLNTEEEARRLVNHALDKGINLIDTARAYNGTLKDGTPLESERIVGQVVSSRTDIREPLIIVTKGHGYTPDAFDEHLTLSLKTLGIVQDEGGTLRLGSVEVRLVYFFHGISRERWDSMRESGVIAHARRRQDEGRFTYLGFSSHNGHEPVIAEAIESGAFQVCELPYNVFAPGLHDDAADFGNMFRKAHEAGLAVINMKAFAGNGMVAKSRLFAPYCDISTEKRLRFCLASPYIATVDAGCKYPEELDADIEASRAPRMPELERSDLIAQAAKVSAVTEHACRECTHCLEKFTCPQGIDFPEILALAARHQLATAFGGAVDDLKAAYAALARRADECIACGQCSPWCEYKLDIPPMMEEAHRLLA